MFANQQIDNDSLPRAEEIRMRPMAPAYVREVMTQWGLFAIALVLVGVVTWLFPLPDKPLLIALRYGTLVAIVLMAGLGLLLYRQALVRGWALRDYDIAYRSGLVFRKTVILPFKRVQHAEVTSGPLQRRFGLATLKFYTAGGSSVDLAIPGLEAQQAKDLRDHILQKTNRD